MHVNMAGIVIGAVVVTLWSVLWLYCRRCERRRRRWQARWDGFAAQQSGLDAELNRTWNHPRP